MRLIGWVFIAIIGIVGFVVAGLFWPSSTGLPSSPMIPMTPTTTPPAIPTVITPGPAMHLVGSPTSITASPTPAISSSSLGDILNYFRHVSGEQQPEQVVLVGTQSSLFFNIKSLMNAHKIEYWWVMMEITPSSTAKIIVSKLEVMCPQVFGSSGRIMNTVLIVGDRCVIQHSTQDAMTTLKLG